MTAIQDGAQPKKGTSKVAGLIVSALILIAIGVGSIFLVIGLTLPFKIVIP
jgi:hypothetical protein